jgi:hypothetical protein
MISGGAGPRHRDDPNPVKVGDAITAGGTEQTRKEIRPMRCRLEAPHKPEPGRVEEAPYERTKKPDAMPSESPLPSTDEVRYEPTWLRQCWFDTAWMRGHGVSIYIFLARHRKNVPGIWPRLCWTSMSFEIPTARDIRQRPGLRPGLWCILRVAQIPEEININQSSGQMPGILPR